MNTYYKGDYKTDAPTHRGWVVGTFMEDFPRKTDKVEIKYWEEKPGSNNHTAKTSAIIECTFVLEGKCKGFAGNDTIEMKAGDYIVISPGTPNNLLEEVYEPTRGFTIKAPSDPAAKKELAR